MDVSLLWVLCVVRYRSLRRADHSSRRAYRLWCVVVCDRETSWKRSPWPTGGCCAKNKQCSVNGGGLFGFSNPVVFFASRGMCCLHTECAWPSFERQALCTPANSAEEGNRGRWYCAIISFISVSTTYVLPGIQIPCSSKVTAGCCRLQEQTHQLPARKINQDVSQFVVMSHTATWAAAPHRLPSPDKSARFLSFLLQTCTPHQTLFRRSYQEKSDGSGM